MGLVKPHRPVLLHRSVHPDGKRVRRATSAESSAGLGGSNSICDCRASWNFILSVVPSHRSASCIPKELSVASTHIQPSFAFVSEALFGRWFEKRHALVAH